jgi:dynein light chain 1
MKASEAKEIKLYAQYPPVEKMDASLSTLSNCEYELLLYLTNTM